MAKITKTYKLEPELISTLERFAAKKQLNQTEAVEFILQSYFAVEMGRLDYSKNAFKMIIDKL